MSERNGYDPTAAFRALADAPRVGFEAAAAVVDRILALGRPGTPTPPVITWDGREARDDGPAPDRKVQLRRARADAERVLDAYGDWARQLLDAVFGLVEGDAPGEVLELGPARAGTVVDAELWLHAPPGRVTVPARLRATPLTCHDGSTIPAEAVSFTPALLDGNGSSAPATRVQLSVPAGTAAGSYYGHVLASGLPEIALAVRAEVMAG